MTWGDVGALFAVLVVGSLIAGAVDAWREQRKWNKETSQKHKGNKEGEASQNMKGNRSIEASQLG